MLNSFHNLWTSIQSSAYLLLSCSKYAAQYSKIKDKLRASNLSLKLLLTTRDEIQAVFDFLKDSKIVRRNWISNWFYINILLISYLFLA